MSVIAIDVDCTICETGEWWYSYLLGHYTLNSVGVGIVRSKGIKPYNLTNMFDLDEDDFLRYFRNPNLYDDKTPRKDALEWIPKLRELGHKVVFVSRIVAEHAKSKTDFLNKWFEHDGIIFTATKQYVKADVMVDDCYEVLNTLDDNVLPIKFRLDYNERVSPNKSYLTLFNWEHVYNHIRELHDQIL